MKICCESITRSIQDMRIPIFYNPSFREYFTRKNKENIIAVFNYCPWCGTRLPGSLRKEFFETLEKEYQIETDIGEYNVDKHIPEEFKSDEWWKKRGL